MTVERNGNRRIFLQAIVAGASQEPLAIDGISYRSPPKPKRHWTVDIGEPVRIREAVGDTVLADGEDTIWALSATDGTVAWTFDGNDERPRLVGVHDTTVYVEDSRRIVAISRTDGSVLWTAKEGNAVISDSSDTYVATRSSVKALDANSGTVRWETELTEGELLELGIHEPSKLLYAGDTEGTVHAVSIDDGTVQWRFETPGGYHVRPISPRELTPHRLVRTAEAIIIWNKREQCVHALSSSGEERWRFDTNAESSTLPGTLGADSAFVVRENKLHSLDYSSGQTRWQYSVEGHLSPHPRTANGSVYINDQDGSVHALRTADGAARWTGSPNIGAAIFVDEVEEGTVTVSSVHGEVATLSDTDGTRRWSFKTDGKFRWFPQTSNSMVYIGTDAGKVHALDLHETRNGVQDALTKPAFLGGGIVGGIALGATYYLVRSKKRRERPLTITTWGDFDLLEALGDGPTGSVHRARTPDGEVVALKRFDGESEEGFADALETWADLDHDGVLPVRDWGTDPEPWVATAYAEGGSLGDHLDDLDRREGVEVVSTVAEVVHRAHRDGVAHGRLHPGNVLFGEADRDEVLVGDWLGAATRADLPRGYAAPEGERVDPVAADVFQLGALAVHVLTGEPPAGGEPEFDVDVPDDLTDVLATALASDPGERYETALQFRDMLRWASLMG